MKKTILKPMFFIMTILLLCNCCSKDDSEVGFDNQTFVLSPDSIVIFEKEAKSGNPDAARKLALYYLYVKLDQKKAFFWNEKAAENGHTIAQFEVGRDYATGDNPLKIKDFRKAKYWLKNSAQKGDTQAKEYLSLMLSKDELDGLIFMANQGDANAAYKLYKYYFFIEQKNESKELYWLRKAAQHGNKEAQDRLPYFENNKK